MNPGLGNVAIGLFLLTFASTAAWYLKRRMDTATGLGVAGWTMTLMVANILQLVGIVVVLVGLFE
jgi:hypothetical protein